VQEAKNLELTHKCMHNIQTQSKRQKFNVHSKHSFWSLVFTNFFTDNN